MNNQKGFTVVEGLLILLILTVIGFAGYTVWNNNQDDSSDSNEATQSQSEDSQKEDTSTKSEVTEEDSAPEGWKTYTGDIFSFIYPEAWDGLDDLAEDWQPAVTSTASGHNVGGGFGPVLGYNGEDSKWYIEELGRFPGDRKVGDEFDLESRTSTSGVTVYDYTSGDGPFSSTALLFVSGDMMVTVGLPSVCDGSECATESTYKRAEIIDFSEQISESVTTN